PGLPSAPGAYQETFMSSGLMKCTSERRVEKRLAGGPVMAPTAATAPAGGVIMPGMPGAKGRPGGLSMPPGGAIPGGHPPGGHVPPAVMMPEGPSAGMEAPAWMMPEPAPGAP